MLKHRDVKVSFYEQSKSVDERMKPNDKEKFEKREGQKKSLEEAKQHVVIFEINYDHKKTE
jgi:hypothetical protein